MSIEQPRKKKKKNERLAKSGSKNLENQKKFITYLPNERPPPETEPPPPEDALLVGNRRRTRRNQRG